MDDQTKIQLSPLEVELLNNSEWILTKNVIMKKAQRLLEQVQQNISGYVTSQPPIFPAKVIAVSPKISKGENYKGLPWLMLDYPRYFDKEDMFAIRTMFWWGNFFSITLHLSGQYKQEYSKPIIRAYDELSGNGFFICVNDEPWHHHFEKENYLIVKDFTLDEFADQIQRNPFIKLSRKFSFSQWDSAVHLLSESFKKITKWFG